MILAQATTQPYGSAEWWSIMWSAATVWLMTVGWRVLLIFLILYLAHRFGRGLIARVMTFALRGDKQDALHDLGVVKRRNTLTSLFHGVLTIFIIISGITMVFHQIGLEIAPILASAGVVGLAIGFGAQSLVKDLLNGMFIILERQFNVGDVIQVDKISGLVEEINLRTTILRSLDGTVSIIPNGEIVRVQVLTRDWSRLVLDVNVAMDSNLDHVFEVLMNVLNQYAEQHPEIVIEKPQLLGVENLGDSAITVRAMVKTVPIRQWDCGRAVRKLIKEAFEQANIELPFPQYTVWIRDMQWKMPQQNQLPSIP